MTPTAPASIHATPNATTGRARSFYVVPPRYDPRASAPAVAADRISQAQQPKLDVKEPQLSDLDVSVPHVDCKFVAQLVQRRRKAKDELIQRAVEGWRQSANGPISPLRWPSKTMDENVSDRIENTALATQEDVQEDPEAPLRAEYEDGVTIIDLRSVDEATVWGMIEGAKIVPMHEFWDAFTLKSSDDFFERFGFPAPARSDTLLLYCQHGPRSVMAAQLLHYLGYTNVCTLADGYYEWAKSYNRLVRRFRLLDHESGVEDQRVKEFLLAREISRDIAPEFNAVVRAELDEIRVDFSRSRGQTRLEMPTRIAELAAEFDASDEQHDGLLTESQSASSLAESLSVSPLRTQITEELRSSPPAVAPTTAAAKEACKPEAIPSQETLLPEEEEMVPSMTRVLRKLGVKKKPDRLVHVWRPKPRHPGR